MNRFISKALVVIVAGFYPLNAQASPNTLQGHRVTGWSAAVHTPLPFHGLPPSPVFEDQTVRMIARPTIGGRRVRVRFSNAFGTSSLEIGGAHIALVKEEARLTGASI